MTGGYAPLLLLASGALLGALAVLGVRQRRTRRRADTAAAHAASGAPTDPSQTGRTERIEQDIAQMRADLDLLVTDYVVQRAADLVETGFHEEKRSRARRRASTAGRTSSKRH
ncbi:hypothetical protein [Rhodosalinus sediminis]|uniref:hypothetical protein n=1 Tax=Rhodosalinus sediminis TaxID=1940533 RepID=UPI0023558A04|nr:hypothetical protein [Rhodosalinus sediminis]